MSLSRLTGLVATAVAGLTLTVALTAQGPAAPKTYKFSAAELAAPSEHHQNPAKLVPRPEGASLSLPPGFTATLFASGGFKRPRNVAQAPNGDIFVVDSGPGSIWVLRDADKNGTIEDSERSEFATGLKQPFGIAFTKGAVYVAATDQVVKYPYASGDQKATAAATTVTPLPNGPTGHWTRNIAFAPDGRSFYVTVGSSDNIAIDPDPLRATVLKFNADGTGRTTVLTGVRNAPGSPSTRRRGKRGSRCRSAAASATTSSTTTWPRSCPAASMAGPTRTSARTRIRGTPARCPISSRRPPCRNCSSSRTRRR